MLNIGLAVDYLLRNAPGLESLGGRIFPVMITSDEEVPFPNLVYGRTSISPALTKGGGKDVVSVTIDIWGTSYAEVIGLAMATREALEHKNGTFAGVRLQDSYLTSASELADPPGFFGQSLVFEFR
jgi:hypothetical protein